MMIAAEVWDALATARGDLSGAQSSVEGIITYLAEGGCLDRTSTEEPLRVELVCYRVLQASGDPRAGAVLEAAHGRLQERAARIGDEALRHSFLENVPYHRELAEVGVAVHAGRSGQVS